jgi:hypothetical protein
MLELLLIDVALCAALIMVVASIMVVRRWRRSSGRAFMPVRERAAVAELAGEGMARRERVLVPGFSDHTAEPDRGTPAPEEPEQAVESQVSQAGSPQPGPHEPAADPDGQQAAAGAATSAERITSHYDEADQPMAGYLAALGWTQERGECPALGGGCRCGFGGSRCGPLGWGSRLRRARAGGVRSVAPQPEPPISPPAPTALRLRPVGAGRHYAG